MSAPDKIDVAAQWRVALRIRDEEIDRLAHASDADFEQAMAKLPERSSVSMVAQWAACGAKLGQAEKLDPAGVADPEVQQMRKKIAARSWRRVDPTKEKPTPR